ncbi:hypothetical protein [Pseudoalteromonas sp. T1lg23B]|uniref:hypothetical protein n=1 Tax=Pseudoalteromonas sp. T1lg23B TaxID=2077097 RepID=UPI001F392A8C|nr:hypothetical protein [Pseudoalteromonas sp. T1lg23B]
MACSTAVAQLNTSNNDLSWGVGIAVIDQYQGYIEIGNETILVPALAIQFGGATFKVQF